MKTISLKKPTYIGAVPQLAAMRAESETSGGYADRKRAGRIAAGLSIRGHEVALVRIAGRRGVLPADDAAAAGADIEMSGTLASVDRSTGEILIHAEVV